MKPKYLFCISIIQTGALNFSAPESVVNLSKKRIVEQLSKNYQIDARFDSATCEENTSYEVFSEGIRLGKSEKTFHSNMFFNYQDLIEGQKINFAINSDRAVDSNQASVNYEGDSAPSRWPTITVIGIGLLGAAFIYSKSHSPNESSPSPRIQGATFTRSF